MSCTSVHYPYICTPPYICMLPIYLYAPLHLYTSCMLPIHLYALSTSPVCMYDLYISTLPIHLYNPIHLYMYDIIVFYSRGCCQYQIFAFITVQGHITDIMSVFLPSSKAIHKASVYSIHCAYMYIRISHLKVVTSFLEQLKAFSCAVPITLLYLPASSMSL